MPGSTHALAFLYSPDNSGPPSSAAEVTSWWASTQARFPNAQVLLSSLDDFAEAVLPIAETLPQVTGEIGQSWSYGGRYIPSLEDPAVKHPNPTAIYPLSRAAPADPAKVAAFRAARRLRNRAVDAGWLDASDPDLYNYERRLWVGGPEHVPQTTSPHRPEPPR